MKLGVLKTKKNKYINNNINNDNRVHISYGSKKIKLYYYPSPVVMMVFLWGRENGEVKLKQLQICRKRKLHELQKKKT